MTDIECPRCGHRALRVATRCPGCGHEFSEEQLRHRPPMPGRRPFRRTPVVAAGAAAIVAAALLARGGDEGAGPGDAVSSSAPVAAPPQDSAAPSSEPVAESAPPPAAPPRTGPPPAPTMPRPSAAPPARRWATEWVNVRESPGNAAPVVRVLEPGDAVLVDSLRRGWYRVVADGRTLGYAHRRYLGASPPEATP